MPRKRNSGRGITYSGQKTTHKTDGLSGFPAVDIFAKPGTPFLAPESGKVVRLSGRGGTKGQVFGWSVYFKGDSGRVYFITHLNSKRAPIGSYRAGAVLGTVSPWSGGATHAHVGVHGGGPVQYGQAPHPAQPEAQAEILNEASIPGMSPSLQPPPNAPPIPTAPMPALPGSGAGRGATDLAAMWRMIAQQPLASPESQRWAQLMGDEGV